MAVETADTRRLGEVETNIGVLQEQQQTTARLLAGIALTLEKLTASQQPSWTTIFTLFSSGVVTASILIGAGMLVVDARISAQTSLIASRVERVEAAIAWTPSFVIVKEGGASNP